MQPTEPVCPQAAAEPCNEAGHEAAGSDAARSDEGVPKERPNVTGRKNKARFSTLAQSQTWEFVWEPTRNVLLARKKHSRRVYEISPDTLVDAAVGQLRLL